MNRTLACRLLAEYLGSAFLAAVVVGSGIAASRLSPDDSGLALLENAAATATGLFAIILMFGFVIAQLVGGVAAIAVIGVLYPRALTGST